MNLLQAIASIITTGDYTSAAGAVLHVEEDAALVGVLLDLHQYANTLTNMASDIAAITAGR